MQKIVIFLSVLAIAQLSSAARYHVRSMPAAIAEETEKVASLSLNISNLILQEEIQYGNLNKNLSANIADSRAAIDTKLDDLDAQIRSAVQTYGTLANTCVSTARTEKAKIHSRDISTCSNTFSLSKIADYGKLGLLVTKLATTMPVCTSLNILSEKGLRKCCETDINNCRNSYEDIKAHLNQETTDIFEYAVMCVSNTQMDLNENVDNVTQNFNDCINNINNH